MEVSGLMGRCHGDEPADGGATGTSAGGGGVMGGGTVRVLSWQFNGSAA